MPASKQKMDRQQEKKTGKSIDKSTQANKIFVDQSDPLLAAMKKADQAMTQAKLDYANEVLRAHQRLIAPAQASMISILQKLAKSSKIDFVNQKWRLDLAEGAFIRQE